MNNSTVDVNSTGNAAPQSKGIFDRLFGSSSTVGISTNMESGIIKSINDYTDGIKNTLSQLDNVDSQGAFKGTGITNAVSKFVEGVKSTANAYLESLKNSQEEIIKSVRAAYQQQDEDISGNVNSDENTVTSAKPNGTSGGAA